jgi:hypothetical protein
MVLKGCYLAMSYRCGRVRLQMSGATRSVVTASPDTSKHHLSLTIFGFVLRVAVEQ